MMGPLTSVAMRLTASNSMGPDTGKPASMMSTLSRARAWAISSFWSKESATPGLCSPSLSVVSKMRMCLSFSIFPPNTRGPRRGP
jgi:hypothetical protein